MLQMKTPKNQNEYIRDPIDTINAKLSQAIAILDLVSADGEDLSRGFTCNHEIICDSLWAVNELITEAKKVVNNL